MFINNIKIENFKGITSPIEINDINKNNILIYGDNGSGKSSVYSALQLTCYFNR